GLHRAGGRSRRQRPVDRQCRRRGGRRHALPRYRGKRRAGRERARRRELSLGLRSAVGYRRIREHPLARMEQAGMKTFHEGPGGTPHATPTRASSGDVGASIREWRTLRRMSQMELALEAGISPRHLSFVETGRSRPSPEVLLALAQCLSLPLRDRNAWLLAAGYAPRFGEQALGAAEMAQIRATLTRLLDAHDPYPGVVLDRHWNVVLANRA